MVVMTKRTADDATFRFPKASNAAGYEAPFGITADPVIFALLDSELAVLMIERSQEPDAGRLALPGGFVGPQEDPGATALRKLTEKTGMGPQRVYLEQLRTYATPGRDPRGWLPSIAYLALVESEQLPDSDESGREARWQPVSGLDNLELAFDHAEIIRDGIERLRGKLWYSNVAVGLLPREFTMGQARRVYEAIADTSYDPGNFARDLLATNLITPTGKTVSEGPGRPGRSYRFRSRKPSWVAAKGIATRRSGSSR